MISWHTGIPRSAVCAVLARNGHGCLRDLDREERAPSVSYVHAAIDDHSRLACVEVHDDERAETVALFTRNAIAHYAEHDITVMRLLTDNAKSYYSKVQLAALADLDVKPACTRLYRPQANGRAERFIRLLINGWAYRRPYESNEERLAALPGWIFNYNHRRPHGGLPPISRGQQLMWAVHLASAYSGTGRDREYGRAYDGQKFPGGEQRD